MLTKITLPKYSALMKKGRVEKILVDNFDRIRKDDPLITITADKANTNVTSPGDGFVYITAQISEDYDVGAVLGYIAESKEAFNDIVEENREKTTAAPRPTHAGLRATGKVKAMPIARRIAAENDIDLTDVEGTGANGLITRQDVENYIRQQKTQPDPDHVTSLSPTRLAMMEHMNQSKVYVKGSTFINIDLHAIKQARQKKKRSYTTYFAYAIASVLPEFPLLNSTFVDEQLVIQDHINLGIALNHNDQLFVPVIKGAEGLTLDDIEKRLLALREKAEQSAFDFDDLSEGTFTLTNSGVYGSLFFSPIINYPQSAIMGLGKINESVVVVDGEIAIRPIMIASLSYDHRIIEGSIAVRFMASVKKFLEDERHFIEE